MTFLSHYFSYSFLHLAFICFKIFQPDIWARREEIKRVRIFLHHLLCIRSLWEWRYVRNTFSILWKMTSLFFFAILVIVVIVRVDIIIVCVGGCCGCSYNNYNNEIQCIQKDTLRPPYWPFALDFIWNEPNHSCVLRGGRNCKHSCVKSGPGRFPRSLQLPTFRKLHQGRSTPQHTRWPLKTYILPLKTTAEFFDSISI